MIRPLGPEGIQQRIAQIRARMEAMRPPRPLDAAPTSTGTVETRGSSAAELSGWIGGFTPFNPFGQGVRISPEAPPPEFGPLFDEAARATGLDRSLLEAVASVESGFDPRARSEKGAVGLMQLMPGTAAALGVTDRTDPSQNLLAGARYLAQLLREFDRLDLALAAYNAGPGAVRRFGGIPPFTETRNYVARVLESYRLRGGGLLP